MTYRPFNQMKSTVSKVIALMSCITGAVHAAENITVQTQDNGAALVNPGMGWMMYFYSNVPANGRATFFL
jgi:hypothetical protein